MKRKHLDELFSKIDALSLSDEEKEEKTRDIENSIERSLKDLNQKMHDELNISAQMRIHLISGMIIAGLGYHKQDGTCVVPPLDSSELTSERGKMSNDGTKIYNKIEAVLAERSLSEEKRKVILEILHAAFYNEQYYLPPPLNGFFNEMLMFQAVPAKSVALWREGLEHQKRT